CTRSEGISMSNFFYNYLDNRFGISSIWSKLEPFDEIEEWDIKIQHYMLFMASNSSKEHQYSKLETFMDKLKEFSAEPLPGPEILTSIIPDSNNVGNINTSMFQYKRWGHSSVFLDHRIVLIFGGNGLPFHNIGENSQSSIIKRQNDMILLDLE